MSTTHATAREGVWPWAGVAGVAAGMLRPLVVAASNAAGVAPGALELALQSELPMWWLVHLGYSAAFGLLFSFLLDRGRTRSYVSNPVTGTALGVTYGIALWTVNVALVWTLVVPAVLPTLSTTGSTLGPLLGHISYGALLGALYPLVRRQAGRR